MTDAAARLDHLERLGLRRGLVPVEPRGALALVEGREVVSFCSNDYLGLADHPAVKAGAIAAVERWGCGSGSSRLVAGDFPLLAEAEAELAAFVGFEAALLVGSGFAANLGLMASLPTAGERLHSDALNHASIIDGCRLSRAEVRVLPHGDVDAATRAFAEAPGGWYVAESLYSMDGDTPDLGALLTAASAAGVRVAVDEAHALGILGPEGRGLAWGARAATGLAPEVLVGTFGKALGSFGAFITCSAATRELLINVARPVVFSTAPAPATVGAALAALRLIQGDGGPREALLARSAQLRRALTQLGYDLRGCTAHIVPVVVGSPEGALALSAGLLEDGIFARAIRPPTVPPGTSRLRLTVSALHTPAQIEALVEAVDRRCRALRIGPHGEGR